ncbi:butyrophilin-like protein 10 isoform X1 [Osmerus eperlanus]|uniref:butyrophilin-like protein 10 isoform X1 n=1 Tax=Osmerus eperlanus TaxID=29151 RepID=UPI002E11B8AA
MGDSYCVEERTRPALGHVARCSVALRKGREESQVPSLSQRAEEYQDVIRSTTTLLFYDSSCLKITTSQTLTEAVLGETVLLPCHFSPPTLHPSLELIWTRRTPQVQHNVFHLKGSQPLLKTQDQGYRGRVSMNQGRLGEGDASLLLDNTTLWDEGDYECFLFSGSDYADVNIQLQLTAPYSQPTIACEPRPREAHRRDGTLMRCQSTGGYPEAEMSWVLHDQMVVNSSEVRNLSRDSRGRFSLQISAVWFPGDLEEPGERSSNWVTCSVYNPRGNQTVSSTATCDISPTHPGHITSPKHERSRLGVLAAALIWAASVCLCLLNGAWRSCH